MENPGGVGGGEEVSGLSVIIPSKTVSNLVPCVAAVRRHEPEARIIVVDDGVDWAATKCSDWTGVEVIVGRRPFVFAEAVNIGIRAAGNDDVVLLNDDAILETPGGFTTLQAAAAENPAVGIIGAVTDLTGQPQQRRQRNLDAEERARHMPGYDLRAVEHIAFVCVYIPRRTIDALNEWHEPNCSWRFGPCDCIARSANGGLLDEDFCVDYGVEDRSYCYWVRRAALCVCVHDAVFVNHSSLHSSFRGDPKSPGSFQENLKIFKRKWGIV